MCTTFLRLVALLEFGTRPRLCYQRHLRGLRYGTFILALAWRFGFGFG